MAARHAVRPRSGGSFHCHKHPPPKLLQSAPLGDVYPELVRSMLLCINSNAVERRTVLADEHIEGCSPKSCTALFVDAAKTDGWHSPRSTLNPSSLRYLRQFLYVLRLKFTFSDGQL
jgi:hypothetical protein